MIKLHHTSFTDAQPLHGWTSQHAMREIWQNFKDGLAQTYKSQKISLQRSETGLITAVLVRTREQVGFIDTRNKGKLVVSQKGAVLSEQHLQLASSKRGKTTIGGHGEGFKVGINLLLRKKFQVTYAMPGKVWRFALRQTCPDADFRNMMVEEEKGPLRDDLYITIEGENAHLLFDPSIDLQLVTVTEQFDCPQGSLSYHTDPAFHGRVYIRGLFVNTDPQLKRLKLVVNLKTKISRDRYVPPKQIFPLSPPFFLPSYHLQCCSL